MEKLTRSCFLALPALYIILTGSGKSTGAEILTDCLRSLGAFHMPFDGYHIPLNKLASLPDGPSKVYRRGAPDTFHSQDLLQDLNRIRHGPKQFVPLPDFDHGKGDPETGARLFNRQVNQVVICEGLYLLHDTDGWEKLKDCFDLCIYVDADADGCMARLKARNKTIPGYSPEEIARRVDVVDRSNAEIVERSKYRADLIVKSAIST